MDPENNIDPAAPAAVTSDPATRDGTPSTVDTAAGGEARGAYAEGSNHPGVAGFIPPRNHADQPVGDTTSGPLPVLVETATPGVARAVADLEADRLDPDGVERARNAKERALAGHRAPDTVDLPEARIRLEDNAAALGGNPA